MCDHERANGFDVVLADRGRHPAREDESRPARDTVAPCEDVLRIRELRTRRVDLPMMVQAEL